MCSYVCGQNKALLEAQSIHGSKWKAIVKLLPGRTAHACESRSACVARERKKASSEEKEEKEKEVGRLSLLSLFF